MGGALPPADRDGHAAEPPSRRPRRHITPLRGRADLAGRAAADIHRAAAGHPPPLDDSWDRDPPGALRAFSRRLRPGAGSARRPGAPAPHRAVPERGRLSHGAEHRSRDLGRRAAKPDHHSRPLPGRHLRVGMARRTPATARVPARCPARAATAATVPAARPGPAAAGGARSLAQAAVRGRATAGARLRSAGR